MPLFGDVFFQVQRMAGHRSRGGCQLLFHILFFSCIMSYETPLCISSGFCELAASFILSTHAVGVTSAEITIK